MRALVTPVAIPYRTRIMNHFGSDLIAYYPLDEISGTAAKDIKNGYDGTYTSPTLAQYAGLGNKPRCGFNGTNTHVDLANASFLAALNQSEGAVSIWFCPYAAALWTAATYYRPFGASGTNNFSLAIYHSSTGTNNMGASVQQNNVTKQLASNFRHGGTGWSNLIITWSAVNNQVLLFKDGFLIGSDVPTACSGSVTGVFVGFNGAANYWQGGIGSVMFFKRPVTLAEAKLIATEADIERITIIGDSISTDAFNNYWPAMVLKNYHNGQAEVVDHAVASSYILGGPSPLAAQVAAAAYDDATRAIIHLGTGDDNAGDMSVLQAEVEEQLELFMRSNPRCVPFYMNVLPRWIDNTTGPEVPKGNVRAAIAAACAALGVTCWDTYTSPWITQAQTSDGLHPSFTAGNEAIANHIGGLLP